MAGIEQAFLEMMPSIIVVKKRASTDKYGKATVAATGTSYNAHIMAETDIIRDLEGNEVVYTGHAILFGTSDATIGDQIVLPDGSTPVIVKVNTNDDQYGPHHTDIYYGRG